MKTKRDKTIPLVSFEQDQLARIQFELMTIENLYARFFQTKSPEIGQVNFYTIFLVTDGQAKMMVDFQPYLL